MIKMYNFFILILLLSEVSNEKAEFLETHNDKNVDEAGPLPHNEVNLKRMVNAAEDKISGPISLKKDLENKNNTIFQKPFEFIPRFVPSGGNELCQKHTLMYLNDLKAWKMWAIQMWDATGKLNSGLFSGNAHRLGDFDSCLSIKGPEGLKPHYCLAAIDVEIENNSPQIVKDVVDKIMSDSFFISRMHEPGHFVPRFSTLGWGICVPKSCDNESLELGLKNSLLKLNSTPGLNLYSGLPKYSCHEERDPVNLATVSTISFFVFIILIALIGTILDVNQESKEKNSKKGRGQRLLLAFSIKRNWADLVDDCKEEFPFLHGIRAIIAFALFVGHRTLSNAAILFTNRNTFTKPVFPISSILRTGTRQTDTFFFMSGFLASYNVTKEITTKGHINVKKRIFSRLFRLLPPLLAVVLYYAYVMEHTGSGPQWGTFVRANADLCKNNLWRNLLFIQNIFPMEEMCAPQTHQIATDLWLFFLAPLFIYVLYKSHIFGIILISSVIIASATSNYYISDKHHLYTYIRYGISLKDFYGHMNKMHLRLLNNSATYLTGIALGYIVRRFKNDMHIGKKAAVTGWILSTLGVLWCTLSLDHLGYPNHKLDPFENVVYTAISPFIMSLSMSWLILMCTLNQGGFLQKIFTSHKLLIFSRLSYSFYLTQFIAIYFNIGSLKSTSEVSLSDFVYIWEFLIILLMATVLTLLLDSPMKEVKNIIFEDKPKTS